MQAKDPQIFIENFFGRTNIPACEQLILMSINELPIKCCAAKTVNNS